MAKLTKRKNDVTFIDPTTMQVRCTLNQCIDKFTIEGLEVQVLPNGNEFTTAYHECNECGQRVKARGDGKRAWKNHIERVASGKNKFYNREQDSTSEKWVDPYKKAMEKFKAKQAATKDKK